MMHKTYLKQSQNGYNVEQTDAYIAAIRTEYEKCLDLIESLRAENAALKEKCNDYEQENKQIIAHCNQRIADLDKNMKSEIANLSGQLNSVYEKLNTVNNSFVSAKDISCGCAVSAVPNESVFTDRVEEIKQQSEILEESVKAQKNIINNDISELTSRFKSLRSRLNTD